MITTNDYFDFGISAVPDLSAKYIVYNQTAPKSYFFFFITHLSHFFCK